MITRSVIFLCGIPRCGKSTFRRKILWNYTAVSSDDYIEDVARTQNKKYHEVFKEHIKDAESFAKETFLNAIHNGEDVVIDRTNTTVESRKKWLNLLESEDIMYKYTKIAMCFVPDIKTSLDRNKISTDHVIPEYIITGMYERMQTPVHEEGFDHIYFIS